MLKEGKLQNATMTTYFGSADVCSESDCHVRLHAGSRRLDILYEDDDGHVKYTGLEESVGHWILESPERRGSATLHLSERFGLLEGSWTENGYDGMWKIEIDEPDEG